MAPIVVIGAIEQTEVASVLVLSIHQPLRKHNEGDKHRYESSNCDELHLFLLPVSRIGQTVSVTYPSWVNSVASSPASSSASETRRPMPTLISPKMMKETTPVQATTAPIEAS